MRIQEILTESQLEQLDEGPLDAIGSVAKGAGKLAGKVIGGVAKGVGAVAGAYGGIKKAFGAGKQASTDYIGNVGKGTNVDVGDEDPAAAPAGGGAAAPAGGGAAAPAAAPAGGGAAAPAAAPAAASTTTPPTAQDINAQGPAGTAPAKAQTGAAGQALAKTTAAVDQQTTDKAGQTVYAQVKANVDKLDKKGKQRILQLLQKSMAAPDPKAAAPGAGAMGAMAKQLGGAAKPNTMANAPVSKTNTAKPGNPNAAPAAAPAADPAAAAPAAAAPAAPAAAAPAAAPAATAPMEVPGTGKRTRGASRVPKKVAPSQAEIDADREARMGPTSDSIIRTGNRLAETFQAKMKIHKARLVAEGLQSGAISIFKK